MRIHTDHLTRGELYAALPDDLYLETTTHGSRFRDHAFEVRISAEPGTDAHGIPRIYRGNTGTAGAVRGRDKAATWIEWGDWMVRLLAIDPGAVIGPYDGAASFVIQTARMAEYRPEREHARDHAARWARELGYMVGEPYARP